MNRPRMLPEGWYPASASAVAHQCERWERGSQVAARGCACVGPHAGWYFSGALAFAAVASLRSDAETVVVIGGHLPRAGGILAAPEMGFETPLGPIASDAELLAALQTRLTIEVDRSPDNSVEIQLPLVRYRYPSSMALWLRAAPSDDAIRLGEALAGAARELGRTLAVVGSTDLTHYGPAYRFTPHGEGEPAVRWAKEQSDRPFIEALVEMDARRALDLAAAGRSACSAGAAVAALTFAAACGARRGTLIAHTSSYDIRPDESFVGYCAIAYSA